jgi:hypothetical protein
MESRSDTIIINQILLVNPTPYAIIRGAEKISTQQIIIHRCTQDIEFLSLQMQPSHPYNKSCQNTKIIF